MKKLLQSFACLSSIALASATYATSYQVFSGINFSNPASLNSVKKEEAMIGDMFLQSHFKFTGTAAGLTGSASSNTFDTLPYGRFAMRIMPKVVAGIDITQPYYTNINYGQASIVNLFAVSTILRDTNYSPRLSYQATERLALGLGLDINNLYNAQLNFMVPPVGTLWNKASSWAYGWDAGLFYVLTPATFLNLSYFSKIVHHASGSSTWGPFATNNLSADVKLPATWIVNLVQMLKANWALSATVRYVQWDTLRYTVLQNTALGITVTVPDLFYNNVSTELATRYQFNEKWAGIAAFDYEPNVQPTATRNVGLPTYTRLIPAVGAEYQFTKALKGKFVYAYVYSRPSINMSILPGVTSIGNEKVNAHAFDFSLSYDV